jgi:uncharacterized repeat protein (TIGR01451 family)
MRLREERFWRQGSKATTTIDRSTIQRFDDPRLTIQIDDREINDRRNTALTASEERVNVNHRWLGTSVVRVRILIAGLVLLAAGCAVLGWGSRSRQSTANAVGQLSAPAIPANDAQVAILPGLTTAAQNLPGLAVGEAPQARSLFAGLPLIFEPNQGQGSLDAGDPRAKFVTRGSGYSLFLGSEGAILSLVSRDSSRNSSPDSGKHGVPATRVESVQMRLAGASGNATMAGADLLPGKSNYFLGNDPAKWRSGVPQFAKVRYENIYPGINLVFYGNQGRLEYDFQVAPGADPAQAELEFNGAKHLELKDGALVIRSESGSVQLEAPRVYQEIAGREQPVEGSFVLRGGKRAGFAIGAYDHSRELVIDPILTFSSYFGGSGDEHATSVAVDGSFNIYLTGSTTSPNLPGATTFPTTLVPGVTQNIYIAKIQPPLGSLTAVLEYVTYLGGDGTDSPAGISVDGRGDAFVAGTTSSDNFPTISTTAYQSVPETGSAGTTHVFVTELLYDASSLVYSSYLSGNGTDAASGTTIDASGFIYVTGTTTSTDVSSATDQFPASNLPQGLPYQSISRAPGLAQFFVTKINTNAPREQSIAYSTYFGGGSFATTAPVVTGGGIAVDTTGNVYFTGTTNYTYTGCSGCSNSDFPILNAYQPCLDQAPPSVIVTPPQCTNTGSLSDAFVAKLNPNASQGQQLIWSTYVGGSGTDLGTGVGLDTGAANVYLIGTTNSTDIGSSAITLNTSAPFQACLDQPGVAAGACVPPAGPPCAVFVPPAGPPCDAFVARLNNVTNSSNTVPVNVTLNYFSYLGGGGDEAGLAITVDSGAGAVMTGWTQSGGSSPFPVFPASNPIQSTLNGTQDAFIARLDTTTSAGQTTTGSWASYFGGSGIDEGTGVTLDVNQNAYFAGDTNSTDLQVQKQLVTSAAVNTVSGYNGGYDAFVTQLAARYSISLTGVLTLGTNQSYISAGNQATFTYTVTNNGPDLANGLTLTDNLSSSYTKIALNFVSASASSGTCGGGSTNTSVSCSLPALQSGSTATITIVVTPTPNPGGGVADFNGGSVQVSGPGNIVLAQTSVAAQMSDFTLIVAPPNGSVLQAGDTATYQVQLTPQPVYGTSIALACTGLPVGAACNFTSNPVTLAGAGSSTLNITTTARPIVTPAAIFGPRQFYAIWLTIPGLTLLGVGAGGGRRRRRIMGVFFACALFGLLLLQPGCSGTTTQTPVSGTPAGTSTIVVTATSGSDTKSSSITLTVP